MYKQVGRHAHYVARNILCTCNIASSDLWEHALQFSIVIMCCLFIVLYCAELTVSCDCCTCIMATWRFQLNQNQRWTRHFIWKILYKHNYYPLINMYLWPCSNFIRRSIQIVLAILFSFLQWNFLLAIHVWKSIILVIWLGKFRTHKYDELSAGYFVEWA